MDDRGPDRMTLAAFAAIVVIGGANVVGVRLSNRELPPFWGAGIRFAAASALFFSFVLLRRLPLPKGRALLGAVLYGALGFGASYAFVYWGLLRVPAGLASILLASVPLLTFFLAFAQRLEPFRLRGLVGGLLAVGGIAVMFRGPISAAVPLTRLLAVVATAVCIAETNVVVKRFPQAHPASTNAVGMATGTGILLAVSALSREGLVVPRETTTWATLAYLVLLGGVALFALYLFVLGRWTASATSYQFVLFPPVAVALSAWLEGGPLTATLILGGALVLAGVYVGALSRPAAEPAVER